MGAWLCSMQLAELEKLPSQGQRQPSTLMKCYIQSLVWSALILSLDPTLKPSNCMSLSRRHKASCAFGRRAFRGCVAQDPWRRHLSRGSFDS